MKRILNFIIVGFILWIAAKFFPPYVQIDSFGVLVLATLLIWVIEVIIAVICVLILAAGVAIEDIFLILIALAVAIFAHVITFSVLSTNLAGFMVNGFWTKVVLSICCNALTISSSKKK